MVSLQAAADKWERKTKGAGAKWHTAASAARGAYCDGFGAFVGKSLSKVCDEYATGIGASSPAAFEAGVTGKKSKYVSGLQAIE